MRDFQTPPARLLEPLQPGLNEIVAQGVISAEKDNTRWSLTGIFGNSRNLVRRIKRHRRISSSTKD